MTDTVDSCYELSGWLHALAVWLSLLPLLRRRQLVRPPRQMHAEIQKWTRKWLQSSLLALCDTDSMSRLRAHCWRPWRSTSATHRFGFHDLNTSYIF